jgi:hypothetical protein
MKMPENLAFVPVFWVIINCFFLNKLKVLQNGNFTCWNIPANSIRPYPKNGYKKRDFPVSSSIPLLNMIIQYYYIFACSR